LTPNVILSDNGAKSIQLPFAIAFGIAGKLWSSNANSPFTIAEFLKTDLDSTGSPTPAVTLSPTTDKFGNVTLAAPNGLAFDSFDDLAVINSATPFSIAVFDASQIQTGGAVVPNTLLVGGNTQLHTPAGCTFGPSVK